ncbi:hypothetical protein PFBG_02604 [Plasmodium falciparum 7G8]|uniref:Uncharacterized protein n=1 Tax=Plasmodium falciparum (isolate 7G8) TaxID=57266 RepID=W7FDT8_PLAF8|nr:hypothetical protein PFBG_02604 [Plasmodium falciparum 7G8]
MYFPISFTFERKKKKKSDIALKNNKDTNDLFLMHIFFVNLLCYNCLKKKKKFYKIKELL